MTANPSKIGADMTDEQAHQMYESAMEEMMRGGPYKTIEASTAAIVRSLLARQPAAIDKQEARDAFDEDDEFQAWWKTRVGKTTNAYHGWMARADRDAAPLANEASKPAAQPYERHDPDNATAPFLSFIPDAKRDELIGALLASLEKSDQRETDFFMVRSFIGGLGLLAANYAPAAPSVEQDERGASFEEWIESVPPLAWENWGRREAAHAAWQARAASTSANVAQGAEAVETCKCQRLGDWKGFHHPLCDKAQPARTALTDDAHDAARYRWLRNEHFPTADNPPLAQVVCKAFDNRHSSDWANMIDGDDLDRAIDDALSQHKAGAKDD